MMASARAAERRKKPGQPGLSRQLILVLAGAALFISLAVWLVWPLRAAIAGAPEFLDASSAAGDGRPSLLFLKTDSDVSGDEWLTRKVLADAGFANAALSVALLENDQILMDAATGSSGFKQTLSRMANLCGCDASELWVVVPPERAAHALSLLQPSDVAGMVLLLSSPQASLPAVPLAGWRRDGRLIMLAGEEDSDSARAFFNLLTGEDATLFPGRSVSDRPVVNTWQTVDGRVSLTLIAALPLLPLLTDPFAVAELAVQLAERAGDSQAVLLAASVVRQAVACLLYPVLAICLLLMVPLLFHWHRPMAKNLAEHDQPAMVPGRLTSMFFWIAALIIAVLPGILLRRLMPQSISWPAALVLLVPGICGWIHVLWRVLVARPAGHLPERASIRQYGLVVRLAMWLLLLAVPLMLFICIRLLPIAGPSMETEMLLAMLVLLNLSLGPAGLAGSCTCSADSRTRPADKQPMGFSNLVWGIICLFFLLVRGFSSAWPVLPAAFLLVWGTYGGHAGSHVLGGRWPASFFQSLCYSILLLPFALMIL